MDNAIETKFRNIISTLLIETENITELVLREGNRVAYQKLWQWSEEVLEWILTDDDIRNFQLALIREKVEDDEALEKIFRVFDEKWHYNYSYTIEWYPFRVNWSRWGWKDWMRIRKLPKVVPTPSELGIPKQVRDIIRTYRWGGLFLFTAPPSNGKSTSIASLIQEVAYEQCLNIVTLEDPREYIYDNNSKSIIEQREIGFDVDSYETGIEACVRMGELNIAVVQEMTTPSIIREVMLLLSKWCMVISTIHAPDTNSTFDSIIESFSSEERPAVLSYLKKYFKCFVSQKLVPRKDRKGRVAVFEILTTSPEIKWYIAEGNTKNIHQLLDRPGNLSFQRDFLNKIETEEITLEDAIEYCPDTRIKDFRRLLGYQE